MRGCWHRNTVEKLYGPTVGAPTLTAVALRSSSRTANPNLSRQGESDRSLESPEPSSLDLEETPQADSRWVENRPSSGWLPRIELRELWAYRELAFFLALRDLKLRYRQTFFGVAWAIMQPLAGVALFSVVFGHLVDVPSDGIPYPVFVYAGLVPWTFFSRGLEQASQSLVDKRELVTKIYMPRLLAPLAAILPGLLDLAISLVILGVFMALYGTGPDAAIVLLPLWVVATVVVTAGVGFWLSAINVQYRDVRHALMFLVQIWLFATPVVYSSSVLEGVWRYVFAANPMTGVVDGFRWALVAGPAPGAEDLISLTVGVLLLVGGVLYFQRFERRFADVV
jgi:lipopolysaccharide transport system permease protein